MYTDSQETRTVDVEVDHGVLVTKIRTKSLLYEMAINEIEDSILDALPKAECALLVDCSELTLHVSSQFLSMLVRVHRKANEAGLKMGICNLSEALRLVYNVTALHSVLPAYETRQRGVSELGEFDLWEPRPADELETVSETDPAESPPKGKIGWALAIGCLLIGTSVGFGMTAYGLFHPDESSTPTTMFRSAIAGRVQFEDSSLTKNDANAMVIAWPANSNEKEKIGASAFQSDRDGGWIDVRGDISFGRTDSNGQFAVPARCRGTRADYHVLLVSNHVDREVPIQSHEKLLLESRLEDPLDIIKDRAFTLGRVQVGNDQHVPFNWTFTSPR
jgi:anti-anti-sigma regulatory factor